MISLTILKAFEATAEERDQYLRAAPWKEREGEPELAADRMAQFEAVEQFILTVAANGFGKRTSSHEYRRSGRGGQGVATVDVTDKTGPVVATFPVETGEHLMLVTDQGKLIRTEVEQIRIAGRATQGVMLFRVAEEEHVVSAAKIGEDDQEDGEGEAAPAA